MEKNQKLFAFKLADQEDAKKAQNLDTDAGKWQARDGVAIAGCTGPDARASSRMFGYDGGIYC